MAVPFVPHWTFGCKGEAKPWYPSVRILRQTQPNDWQA
jgi:hypothetical protein